MVLFFLWDITGSVQTTYFTLWKYWAIACNRSPDSPPIHQRKVKSCGCQMQRASLSETKVLTVLWSRCLSYLGSWMVIYISFIQRFLAWVWVKKPTSDFITALHTAWGFKVQFHCLFNGIFFKPSVISKSVCSEKNVCHECSDSGCLHLVFHRHSA